MCVRDSVGYVWLHCITWIITARSPRPRLSLNGQSQLKLGYRRPRAEQPGHQESKIKQRLLLPPKIDHRQQQETRLTLRKEKPSCRFFFSPQKPTHPLSLLLTSGIGMGSCRSGRLRRPWWPNKRGASLEGHGLTPGAKSMALLLAGTTRLHSVGTTFEGRWKCPDEGNQAFSLHYSISNNKVFLLVSGPWCSLDMDVLRRWSPREGWKGKEAIVQSQQTVCLGSSDSKITEKKTQ